MGTSGYVGYNSEKALIASAYLSVALNLKHFDEVELITDQRGYDLFVKKWRVPFTNVIVCLDEMNGVDARHWNMAKLTACAMQTKPFIHQDLDVFWFKRPEDRILNAKVCAQDIEREPHDLEFYTSYMTHAEKHFKEIPEYIDLTDYRAINCGIIGFNDLSMIETWVADAWKYIDYYDKHEVESKTPDLGGVVAEQMTIYHLLNHLKVDVEFVITNLEDKYKSNQSGFVHLIAGTKRETKNEEMVYRQLASVYPLGSKLLKLM